MFNALNILCYAVPHNHYTLLLENISLYHIIAGVPFFLSFILCLIPHLQCLNVTVFQYNILTKVVYNQTSNLLLVDAQHTLW
jgi:hypothetical protein